MSNLTRKTLYSLYYYFSGFSLACFYSIFFYIINYFSSRFFGIFLYVYIVDTLILPLSPDFVFPIAVGMNPFVMIPIIGGASALGGMTSYSIGRLLYKIPAIKKLTGKAYMKWGGYIQHYGVLFVMLAGILPLPFSTICVAAGAVQMDVRKVALACLTRFIRAAIYFALFSLML